jgi:hypothetical protein
VQPKGDELSELEEGRAAVGVLTWDYEVEAVTDELRNLGGTPQTLELAHVTSEA